MLKSKFNLYLNFLKTKSILITSHALADLDGLASAVALHFFFQSHLPSITAEIYFSNVSKKARSYIEKLKAKFSEFNPIFEDEIKNLDFEAAFILDTNKLNKVGGSFSASDVDSLKDLFVVFIDHHYMDDPPIKEQQNRNAIIYEDYTSTSEIIVDLFNEFDINLPLPLRYLLIAGIVIDSGYLKFANQHTYKSMADLLDNDIKYHEILSMLKIEPHISEKIAKIKGAQRVELIRENDWLIGISHVSSFEASVANTLIKIGFDIAIVLSERKDEVRVSLRAKQRICDQCALHLGKMLEDISEQMDAIGGGHDGAASIKIRNSETEIKTIILAKIKEILNN